MPVFYRHPVNNPIITGGFGAWYDTYRHRGVDYGCPIGTSIYAPADGNVYHHMGDGSFGLNVSLQHDDGTYTIYAHLSEPMVFPGQRVVAHQQIGRSGNTGKSTGPHLHWQWCKVPYYPRDISMSMDPIPMIVEEGMDPRIDALVQEVERLKMQMAWVEQVITMPQGLDASRVQVYRLNTAMMEMKAAAQTMSQPYTGGVMPPALPPKPI